MAAVRLVQFAADPPARLAAIGELLAKFPATVYRDWAIQQMAASLQRQVDYEHLTAFAERTLQSDPRNFRALLIVAYQNAARLSEFDPQAERKLAAIERQATEAIELIKVAPKPNSEVPENQWINAQKDFTEQAEESLRLAAAVRRRLDEIRQARDRRDQTEATLRKTLQLAATPERKAQSLLALGLLAESRGDRKEARTHFRDGLSLPAPATLRAQLQQRLSALDGPSRGPSPAAAKPSGR